MAAATALLIGLTSCGGIRRPKELRPRTAREAGSAHVAVLSIAHWEEYVDQLRPSFKMDSATALQSVMPSTRGVDDAFLSALDLALKVAPPTSGTTSTRTRTTSRKRTSADEASTRTSSTTKDGTTTSGSESVAGSETGDASTSEEGTSETEESKPGDVSKVEGGKADAGGRTAGAILQKAGVETKLGRDPMLAYAAATALQQEVELLNRYVGDAALRYDAAPYVLRLQLTLMPAARREPYDAYVNLSFFSRTSGTMAGPTAGAVSEARIAPMAPQVFKPFQKATPSTPAASPPASSPTAPPSTSSPSPPAPTTPPCARSPRSAAPTPSATPTPEAGKASSNCRSPVVVPLLVTDALESTAHSSAEQHLRQLSFGLLAMIKGFQASANVDQLREELRKIVGSDLTSLTTVGRVTDNTLRVRLGAMQQVEVDHAMVPRTYNVTLVVLVPRACNRPPERRQIDQLSILARTTFRDADRGTELPEDRQALVGRVQAALEASDPRLAEQLRANPDLGRNAMAAVLENDYPAFVEVLGSGDSYLSWTVVARVVGESPLAQTRVDLPIRRPARALPEENITLFDDGKRAMATIRSGRGFTASRLISTLGFCSGLGSGYLSAQEIEVDEQARQVRVTFPSLVRFDPAAEAAKKPAATPQPSATPTPTPLSVGPLCLFYLPHDKTYRWSARDVDKEEYTEFCLHKVLYINVKDEPKVEKTPGVGLTLTAKVIVANADGFGDVDVRFEFPQQGAAASATLMLLGADIASSTQEPAECMKDGLVTKSCTLHLRLRNLSDGETVSFQAKGANGATTAITDVRVVQPSLRRVRDRKEH